MSEKSCDKTEPDYVSLPIPEETATTWKEVVELVSRSQDKEGSEFFYRGQSVSDWSLTPSLCRLFENLSLNGPAALEVESDALAEFKRRARLWLRDEVLPSEQATALGWWPIMQHFSCPTRLLDWTRSPWVALYFSIENHLDKDGAIWSFFPGPMVREKKDAFEAFSRNPLEPNVADNVFVSGEAIPTERLEAQQGVFTVGTRPRLAHQDYVDQLACLRRIVVKASIKQECLFRLKAMNITAASLFPGLDGLGKAVAESMQLVAWTRENHNARIREISRELINTMTKFYDVKDDPNFSIHTPPSASPQRGPC